MAKINNIFNFLKDYNELSNPVITELDKQKWSLRLADLPQIKEVWSIYRAGTLDELKILEVRRPVLEPCPVPDALILEWLEGNWKKLSVETISYQEVISVALPKADGTVEQVEKHFDADPNRKKLFGEWLDKRNQWRNTEFPKEQGLNLYNNLFRLYSDIKKESESVELILGDGLIRWRTATRMINHPVLLQKVNLEFLPELPAFIVKCEELKTELYTPMLRIMESVNQAILSDLIQDIEASPFHIADTVNNSGLFQRLINGIDENGKFVATFENSDPGPLIMTAPVLFLRKRTLGFSLFIDKILVEIESQGDATLPDFFANMIGAHRESGQIDTIEENWNQSGIDQAALLTLPANNEQLKIIRYLNNYGAVLVQGPPGTGKTHTIANLIGHLLSQGNSVLVTSHTEKALNVLKEKVYKSLNDPEINLQNLCISLLSSSSPRKEMDVAINEIAEKATSFDLVATERTIGRLETVRKELINELKAKTQELTEIRSLEYRDLLFDRQPITPLEAARFINSGRGKFDYLPGSTSDATVGLPLPLEALHDLYSSNRQLSCQETELLDKDLPLWESLWDGAAFKLKVANHSRFTAALAGWTPRLVFKEYLDEALLSGILAKAGTVLDSLVNLEDYQLKLANKALKDPIYCKFWATVFTEVDALLEKYEQYRRIRFTNDYVVPAEVITEACLVILDEIVASGAPTPVTLMTGFFKPKWKKLQSLLANQGGMIARKTDFENVATLVRYELQKMRILGKINKLGAEISWQVALTAVDFEEKIGYYRQKILAALSWYDKVWQSFSGELGPICGDRTKWETLSAVNVEQPLEAFRDLLEQIVMVDLRQRRTFELLKTAANDWDGYNAYLEKYRAYGSPFTELIGAVAQKDVALYQTAYAGLGEIMAKQQLSVLRRRLLEKLQAVAPDWAIAVMNREGIHGECRLPDNIEAAWKWRQLSNQLARFDSYDANQIQKELSRLNEQLLSNARRLAYLKAWRETLKNKTAAQTQAIEGWRQTIRHLGKGTGKNAPVLLQKARELMPLCQTAIPVWIMALNRVAENFDPQYNQFDVVIIDEASQADLLALSVLYLGKKVIIVGDDEQVSPDAVGLKTVEVNALIEQHLQGIPNNHLYNGQTSVYDMARASGFKPLMLTEHFRCLPEIIEFSNRLSYHGKIKPLRDASGVNIKPAVVECRVPNAIKTIRKTNEIEAEYCASLVCACIETENYRDKTFGVISLLGQEQAYEIDRLLQVNLEPQAYERHRIQCGTAPQFQGDERDVIFLSVVEGPSESGSPVRLLSADGKNDLNRKRYNVAASRAKDQMWVVHSLNPEVDLQPDDLRLKLIRYASSPAQPYKEERLNLAESDFEKKVMARLVERGYQVIPQWQAGAYRIDMVVADAAANKRIALECDGERWHTQDDLPDDLKRQAILERLGWRFVRVRGSAFYRDPEATMEWVCAELADYGIQPCRGSRELFESGPKSNGGELVEQIKRRAAQIRQVWHEAETGT